AMKNKPVIVANDTHFLNKIGIYTNPAENYFSEIAPNIWFIPNCVDSDHFRPISNPRKKQILVPRNVRRDRGIHLAIKAFDIFNNVTPGYELVIAGFYNENDHYFIECNNLIQKLNLTNCIQFTGSIEHTKMRRFYQESMISIIPTIEIEGTSLSALESMACKTPTISTNAGGLIDLPTLKCDFTPHDIADKMVQTIESWENLSEKQYQITKQTFSIANWEKAWITVINSMMEKSK
ncbi:MAG: glycosyltransferase, partial [Flavobacteriales bacterium]|nr:glycosyltransferase [Flavobacteriales bacterium]